MYYNSPFGDLTKIGVLSTLIPKLCWINTSATGDFEGFAYHVVTSYRLCSPGILHKPLKLINVDFSFYLKYGGLFDVLHLVSKGLRFICCYVSCDLWELAGLQVW